MQEQEKVEKVAEMEEGPGGGGRYRSMRISAEEVMSEFKTVVGMVRRLLTRR